MRAVKTIQNVFHLCIHAFAEFFRSELEARFNLLSVLFRRDLWVLVFVLENPAFAFSHNAIAKSSLRDFISPLSESAFSEFLNIALMNKRHRWTIVFERKLNRATH